MSDESKKLYSLSEAAQTAGLDEKTIHLYAHKGLIQPHFSNDQGTRFTELECARLKFIKRADQLGYDTESILNLIGQPDEVLQNKDSLTSCRNFAMETYKRLYEELNHCEPLEQINKQADLKLITAYIKDLKALQNSTSQNDQKGSSVPSLIERTDAIEQTPSRKDRHHNVQTGTSVRSFDFKRHILRNKPKRQAWMVAALTAALIVIALVIYQGRTPRIDETRNGQAANSKPNLPQNEPEGTIERLVAAKPMPPPAIPRFEDQTQIQKVAEQLDQGSLEQQVLTDEPNKVSLPENKDTAKTQTSPQPELSAQALTEQPNKIDADSGFPETHSARPPETQTTDAAISPIVDVASVNFEYDKNTQLYRVGFKILKTKATDSPDLVSGYVFVRLRPKDASANQENTILPDVDFKSGKPDRFPSTASFAIRYFRPMTFSIFSTLPPDEVAAAQFLVYSTEGDLLLDKIIDSPSIQSLIAESTEPLNVADTKIASQTRPRPLSPNESSSPAKESGFLKDISGQPPSSQGGFTTPNLSQMEKASAAKEDAQKSAVLKTATANKQAENNKESTKSQSVSLPRKTDNPEAGIWEQRSYDAAVKGDFDGAIAYATKAIELDPGRVIPYINRSWSYIEKGMPDQALPDCETALLLDPQNAYAYNNKGLAYQRRSETQKAQESYRKACDLGLALACQNLTELSNKSRIADLINQSQAFFKSGDWDGVIRVTSEIIRLDPHNAVAYTNRSAAYAQLDSLNNALEDSNVAIENNPNFSLAFNNRGYVYELLGNNNKATADYLKSCSLGLALGCENHERLNKVQ